MPTLRSVFLSLSDHLLAEAGIHQLPAVTLSPHRFSPSCLPAVSPHSVSLLCLPAVSPRCDRVSLLSPRCVSTMSPSMSLRCISLPRLPLCLPVLSPHCVSLPCLPLCLPAVNVSPCCLPTVSLLSPHCLPAVSPNCDCVPAVSPLYVSRCDHLSPAVCALSDPVQCKRNVSRSISSGAVADLIVDRLRAACLLFGVPRTEDGPAVRLAASRGPPPPEAAARLAERLAGLSREQLRYQFDTHLLCGETVRPGRALGLMLRDTAEVAGTTAIISTDSLCYGLLLVHDEFCC